MAMLLLLLLQPLTGAMATTGSLGGAPAAAEFEFGGLRFGQGAPREMVCVGGACIETEDGKPSKNPIASYKFPRDITFYGGVEISPPVYDFFEEQLIRVRFRLLCPPKKADQCSDDVLAALDEAFGMTAREQSTEELSSGLSVTGRLGLLGSGDIVLLSRERISGAWRDPHVSIENPGRMDELRRALNPAYVPAPRPRSAGGR
jgi:hypothetical protein